MNPPLWQEAAKAIEKAGGALENANYNLKGQYYPATVNRAYYACFYCMTGLLYVQNVFAKTHQGVRTKFSALFVKTGIFPEEASILISDLFAGRQEADYDFDSDINEEEATELVKKAEKILHWTKAYFHQIRSESERGA